MNPRHEAARRLLEAELDYRLAQDERDPERYRRALDELEAAKPARPQTLAGSCPNLRGKGWSRGSSCGVAVGSSGRKH